MTIEHSFFNSNSDDEKSQSFRIYSEDSLLPVLARTCIKNASFTDQTVLENNQNEESESNMQKTQSVFLVEDSDDIRDLIAHQLRNENFIVHEAIDGQQASNLIRNLGTKHLALITDIDMPNLKGDQLILQLDQDDLVFSCYIVISSHGAGHPTINALKSTTLKTPIHFLPKPFLLSSLVQILRTIEDEV